DVHIVVLGPLVMRYGYLILLNPDNRSGYFRDKCTTAVTIIAPTIKLAGAFLTLLMTFFFA
ncbi:hypothetical protein, partial [Escherichia coli]